MGVPLEVAREWERHHEHFLFSISAGLAVRTLVVDHFATVSSPMACPLRSSAHRSTSPPPPTQ